MPTAAETLAPPPAPAAAAPAAAAPQSEPTSIPGLAPPSTVPAGWWDRYKDPEIKSFVATKNLPDEESAMHSYWSLERLFGAEKAGRTVMTPKDDADIEGQKAFGAKIGVPANADDYKLPIPEGQDDGFAKIAAGWMQQSNIAPWQGRKMAELWNAHAINVEKQAAAQKAEVEAQAKAKSEAELAALNAEWGPKAAENTEMARRGFREFATRMGINTEPQKFEDSIGTPNFLKLFVGLGALQAESKFAGNDNQGNFSSSQKIEMQGQIDKIQADRSAGLINDFQWRNEVEQKYLKLIETVSRIP